MNQQHLSRRSFLLASAALGLATSLPAFSRASQIEPTGRQVKVGLQLYTVRDAAEKDLLGVLENVARVGFSEVEFAGYFGHSPKVIRKHLDSLGLTAPSAHIPLADLQSNLDKVIEDASVVGHNFLVMPWLSPEQRSGGINTYYKLAEFLNGVGEKCQRHGLHLAYHNHDFEFQPQDGELPYDVLLKQVAPEHLLMELDLYWITKAGYDPLEYFARHPGRFPLWHVKDLAKDGSFADVGSGIIDFESIFAAGKQAGFRHGFVERDKTDNVERTIENGFKETQRIMTKFAG